jgi:tripartite-type tricarboxylate transporter receptor subunit TctC
MGMMRILTGAVLVVAMALGVAQAEDPYPARPVSMVVAFPPGGLADNTARPVAAVLERLLKQPVVVVRHG